MILCACVMVSCMFFVANMHLVRVSVIIIISGSNLRMCSESVGRASVEADAIPTDPDACLYLECLLS